MSELSELRIRVKSIEADIKQITTNDLPHISAKIATLLANQKWLIALSLVILGAIVAGLVQASTG